MVTNAPDQVRARILEACKELFFAHGLRAVTMDDVANRLGMSKKTIYQYFTQKEEIIRLLAHAHLEEDKRACTEIMESAANALQGVVNLTVWDMQRTRELNPLIPQEVRRYFPQTWELFLEFNSTFSLNLVKNNLTRGIREGLYRPEIDVDALAQINIAVWASLTDPIYFPSGEFPLVRLQYEYLLNYLHGIVTPRGAVLLQQYLIATPVPR